MDKKTVYLSRNYIYVNCFGQAVLFYIYYEATLSSYWIPQAYRNNLIQNMLTNKAILHFEKSRLLTHLELDGYNHLRYVGPDIFFEGKLNVDA